jgi:hypothetical protein
LQSAVLKNWNNEKGFRLTEKAVNQTELERISYKFLILFILNLKEHFGANPVQPFEII